MDPVYVNKTFKATGDFPIDAHYQFTETGLLCIPGYMPLPASRRERLFYVRGSRGRGYE
jgi:hypothetical protein